MSFIQMRIFEFTIIDIITHARIIINSYKLSTSECIKCVKSICIIVNYISHTLFRL